MSLISEFNVGIVRAGVLSRLFWDTVDTGVFDSAKTSERDLEMTGVGVNVMLCGLDVIIDIGLRFVVGLITVLVLLAVTAADNIGSAFIFAMVDGFGLALTSGFKFACGVNVVLGLDTVD
jgi:hypothetical protein